MIKANKTEKYIFETQQTFYGQQKGIFLKHSDFVVPQGTFLINNFPTVVFSKKDSRWEPSLLSQNCIEINLTSSKTKLEGEVALVF